MKKAVVCVAGLLDLLVIVLTECPNAQWQLMGGFCYLLFKDFVDWNTADEACHNLNSYLAFPKTPEEVNNTYTYIYQNGLSSIWVGIDDFAVEGQYVCQDGSLLSVSDSPWLPGNPDSYTPAEDCIEMRPQIGFNDAECYWQKGYICQVKDSYTPDGDKYCRQATSCVDASVLSPTNVNTTVQCGVRCLQDSGCCAFYYDSGVCVPLVMTDPGYTSRYQTKRFDRC